MNIYLLQYNNYANRTIKGFATIGSYSQYIIASELDVNRSISDNLSCSITFNDKDKDITSINMPNYCIITDGDDQSPGNIVSRWFVMSCKHKGGVRSDSEGGQYTIDLKRDVIYDFHQNIENSTVLCSRGYKNITSPLFLNKDTDEFPVNSIKYKEALLVERPNDDNFPWIYIYRSKTSTIVEDFINEVNYGYEDMITTLHPEVRADEPDDTYTYTDSVRITYDDATITCNGITIDIDNNDISDLIMAGAEGVKTLDAVETSYDLIETNKPIDFKLKYLYKDGFVYTLTYNALTPGTSRSSYKLVLGYGLKTYLIRNGDLKAMIEDAVANSRTVVISLLNSIVDTVVVKNKRNGGGVGFGYHKNGLETNGQFDILCVPYADIKINGKIYTKRWADLLISTLALNSNTYDIQILPYGPAELGIITTDEYYSNDLYGICDFTVAVDGNTPSTAISSPYNQFYPIMVKSWKREFDLQVPQDYTEALKILPDGSKVLLGYKEEFAYAIPKTTYTNAELYAANKRGLNCYDIRLVSPDSQAIEDIQPFFNYKGAETGNTYGELIRGFHCYMKLQPYQPYIQVLPIYKGWNIDWRDYRGLICGAGFSLAMANDKWAEYTLNNKNYSAQFDRQVEGMRFNQISGAISGFAGAAGSAINGGMKAGAAGAIVSGALGTIDAVSNIAASEFNIETAKKEFKWNIQNIQNMSRTLKQIDAQNPNFRFYPYLEVFRCTKEEMDRLLGYIEHHGSKIGAEGTFRDFIDTTHTYPYIECLIDIYAGNNVSADVLTEINNELNIGVKYLIDLTPIS